MYKSKVVYPYGRGRKIRNVYYAHTIFGAYVKALWGLFFHNRGFFEIEVEEFF